MAENTAGELDRLKIAKFLAVNGAGWSTNQSQEFYDAMWGNLTEDGREYEDEWFPGKNFYLERAEELCSFIERGCIPPYNSDGSLTAPASPSQNNTGSMNADETGDHHGMADD